MEQGDVPLEVRDLVFDFFHKFSRFEFALKEAGSWRKGPPGSPALPDWARFVAENEAVYQLTAPATALIAANPMRQVVADDENSLEFREVDLPADASELAKVSRLAQTVRNNLFHGGKHDSAGWDHAARIHELLPLASAVLDEFAELAGIGGDYKGAY
jgi:hypothetical protein